MKRLVKWDKFINTQIQASILKGNRSRKKPNLLDFPICLDTETSHNHDVNNPIAWIYQWAFTFQESVIVGRTPVQLMNCLEHISMYCSTLGNCKAVVYVHNLSYDWAYLYKFMYLLTGDELQQLAVGSHKVISCEKGNIIFKCSYKLSNRSLDNWGKTLGIKHLKKKGLIDYDKIRNQYDRLTFEDWKYQIYDVIALEECIYKQLELYKDTLYTIPLTSTGYVRRECLMHFQESKTAYKHFQDTRLNVTLYKGLRQAFMGGFTHGNCFVQGDTVKGNIRHRDFVSHYPSCLITQGFPVGRFYKISESNRTLSYIQDKQDSYCFLIEIMIKDITVRDGVAFPSLSFSKCNNGRVGREQLRAVCDNGRVLRIKEQPFVLYLTELDLKWLVKQYKFSYSITNLWQSKKGAIPQYLQETILEFFYNKTKYKELLKTDKHNREYDNELMKSKNLLNGLYGCLATDIVRESYEQTITGEWVVKEILTDDAIAESLDKYYNNRSHCMIYQLGVWTTAHARNLLMEHIQLIEDNDGIPLYCDTDSCFYVSNDKVEQAIEQWNAEQYKKAIKNKWYIEYKDKIVSFNKFDDENEDITAFRFLHAKCYAYIVGDSLECTIAGVSKYGRNNVTRDEELGTIDDLRHGKRFIECGGTKCQYFYSNIAEYNGNIYSDSAIISNNEKTLNDVIDNNNYFITGEWSD